MTQKAIIDCRVSSKRQELEGHGLESQESLCRDYCKRKGYEIVAVFQDTYTGKGNFWNRASIRDTFKYLEEHPEEHFIVVFDDIKRFARDLEFHIQLRKEFRSRNATPECVTFEFRDTPEGRLAEHVLAAASQYERESNAEQVLRKMKARFKAGYWISRLPMGYEYKKLPEHGKIAQFKQGEAEIVKKCRLDFAAGKIPNQTAVKRFLLAHNLKGLGSSSMVDFLLNEFYSGWCVSKRWNLRVKGKHPAMHSEEIQRRIKDRLLPLKRKTFIREDVRPEFSFRGNLFCADCTAHVTASWSRGRNGTRYPYYHCKAGCFRMQASKLEGSLIERMREAVFPREYLELLDHLFIGKVANIEQEKENQLRLYEKRKAENQKKITNLIEAISEVQNPKIRIAYEGQLDTLMKEADAMPRPSVEYQIEKSRTTLEKGKSILLDPVSNWKKGNLRERKIIQNLVFKTPILVDADQLGRTACFSFVLAALEGDKTGSIHYGGPSVKNIETFLEKNWHSFLAELERWSVLFSGLGV